MNIFKTLSSVFALAVLFIFAVTAAEAQTTAFTFVRRAAANQRHLYDDVPFV